MSASAKQDKPSFFKRRYLLDRASQLPFALLILGVLVGIGTLYAAAVFFLADTHLLRGTSVGEMRLVLLVVHTGYGLIGGGILFVSVLLLTHRFVGPAHVMGQAVRKLRKHDFTARLSLRKRDYHKDLAEQLRLLRDELAEASDARTLAYERLETLLENGKVQEALAVVRELRAQPAAIDEAVAA
jgi:methyl-accepting chemotaxis protein